MKDDFERAKRILRTSGHMLDHIVAINGCCYGVDNNPDKGSYFKYCGQRFWELISGDSHLYTKIIEPLGHEAKEKNEAFDREYARVINNLLQGFVSKFCKNGEIDWTLLIEYNSGIRKS